jgi:hypothetical protein
LLPTKSFTLLSAHAKAGKSTLAMTVCHSVVTGRAVFGKYPVQRSNVLYWIPDDTNLERLARTWRAVAGADSPNGMLFNTEHHQLPEAFSFLKRMITEHQIGLVVVDAYTSIRDEGGFDFVRSQYNDMRQFSELAQEMGCSIVLIHHSAKGIAISDESTATKAPAGSYGMTAGPDQLWSLVKVHGSERALHLEGRDIDKATVVFRRNAQTRLLEFVIDGPAAQHWPQIRMAGFYLKAGTFTAKDLGNALGLGVRQAQRAAQDWFYDEVVNRQAGSYVFAPEILETLKRAQIAGAFELGGKSEADDTTVW